MKPETNQRQPLPKPDGFELRTFEGEQFEVRLMDEEKRTISGYGIVFNKESRLLGDWFVEIVKPEAVSRAMENPDIRSEFNHVEVFLLGRKSSGTARFEADEVGVRYIVDVPLTDYGDNVLELVRRGDLKGSSFQFIVGKGGDDWKKETRNGKDIRVRTITEFAAIAEMGPVTNPAYPDTSVAKRSFEARMLNRNMDDDMNENDAKTWINIAIRRHERHMQGEEPTAGNDGKISQKLMMEEMKYTLQILEGNFTETTDWYQDNIGKFPDSDSNGHRNYNQKPDKPHDDDTDDDPLKTAAARGYDPAVLRLIFG